MSVQLFRGPFTADTYQRLAELGVLRESDRVELIHGQVVEMSPIGDRHASCVRNLNHVLSRALRGEAMVDVQNPVVLGQRDVPQPDLTVLRRRADGYPNHPRPADILLVIEVADSSLVYDRDTKIPLYAGAGLPEAWLVNLPADRVDIYRNPVAGGYAQVTTAVRGDTLTPLALLGVRLSVDQILGQQGSDTQPDG